MIESYYSLRGLMVEHESVDLEDKRRANRLAMIALVIALVSALASPGVSWFLVGRQQQASLDQSRFQALYGERKALYAKIIADADAYAHFILEVDNLTRYKKSVPRSVYICRASDHCAAGADNLAFKSLGLDKEALRERSLLGALLKDSATLSLISTDKLNNAAYRLVGTMRDASTDVVCQFNTNAPCSLDWSVDVEKRAKYLDKRQESLDESVRTFSKVARDELLTGGPS